MIKKLDRTLRNERDSGFTISEPVSIGEMQEKINELIDAVNTIQKEREEERFEIQVWIDIVSDLRSRVLVLEEHAHPTATTEPADPYAEQRKWIGKVCWFWDGGAETRAFGELNQVDTEYNDAPFQTNFGQWYEHCEPVKPDDDIIYKGV